MSLPSTQMELNYPILITFLAFVKICVCIGIENIPNVNRTCVSSSSLVNLTNISISKKCGNIEGRAARGNLLTNLWLTSPELIIKDGYPFESHNVSTKDGYLLTLHRIPFPGNRVVLLFHGMTQTSRDFLVQGRHRAPAYKMYEAGFDVWLVNVRGNSYSMGHSRLHNNDPAYWNFSVDDVIKHDGPLMIDYILWTTGQSSLTWIGYSLGTAVGLGLLSIHPEYNDKIEFLVLLGTTAYVSRTKSLFLKIVSPTERILNILLTTLNHGEIIPKFIYPLIRTLLPLVCLPEAKLRLPGICSFVIFSVFGFGQANPETLPLIFSGTPGTLSVKMLTQWFQWVNKGQFSFYDYGKSNLEIYGDVNPPNYDLRRVTTRVVNFHADNDWFSVPRDIHDVVNELPNVVRNIRVKLKHWNHLDYIYGRDTDVYVWQEIIRSIGG